MAKMERNGIELETNNSVEIENLYYWSIGFDGFNGKSHIVEPRQKYRRATLDVIYDIVLGGHVAFAGVDENGNHAAFYIADPDVRMFLFGTSEEPIVYREESIDKLINIKDIKKFESEMKNLIKTKSEKKATLFYVDNHENLFKKLSVTQDKLLRSYCTIH